MYNKDKTQPNMEPARAPYNFVPLNQEVVKGGPSIPHDIFLSDQYSGYINIEIKALTDIFVRGILEKNFMVNGKYALPGSSLRGLVRTLIEIVSYSKIEFVDKKKKFFFRNIKDQFYKEIFLRKENGIIMQNSKPGWISMERDSYFLQEAPKFYKVNIRALNPFNLDKIDTKYHTQDVWFEESKVIPLHIKTLTTNNGPLDLRLNYNKVNSIQVSDPNDMNFTKGTLLITGLFAKTKHFQWIIPPASTSAPKIDVTKLMEEYLKDETRDEGANLIEALKKSSGRPIPCFFIANKKNEPEAIGHTGIFRYPYAYDIGHAVRQNDSNDIDMAKNIFGFASEDQMNKENLISSGKVFFGDAMATYIAGTEFGAMKILSSPKPTSFQLYLEQENGKLKHWGTESHKIRGHKQYWHQKDSKWRNADNNEIIAGKSQKELIQKILIEKNVQYTIGEVIKKDSTFLGRIRFDNLSTQELGALLFVLDLPNGCAHKLGMGKALGMGSVQIKPTLFLTKRQARYSDVFDENGNWFTGTSQKLNFNEYKDLFAQYIGQEIRQPEIIGAESFWSKDLRLKELRHLLIFDNNPSGVPWANRTRYMEITHPEFDNEYKDRPVLPLPSNVVQSHTYRNR